MPTPRAADLIPTTTPLVGRGAWPNKGTGGTLSLDGTKPGAFYRAPAADATMPGLTAARSIRAGASVNINDYAVWAAIKAIQKRVGLKDQDGLFGADTANAVRIFQQRANLVDDGIVGPATSKRMWLYDLTHLVGYTAQAKWLAGGHITYESGWDPGAVGVTTPVDLGLGQINGPAQPALTVDQRLDPNVSLPFVAQLVTANLGAFGGNVDDAVLAYNLGRQGARDWVAAGRPQMWGQTDTTKYITRIKEAAGTPPTATV
jgi:peptidoglycan hydrolase-like protein with peptidoglycan-binding domain